MREPWPASTGWLIVSIIFANKVWILDATSMSLYWVARLPIARPLYRSPLAPKATTDRVNLVSVAPKRNKRTRKIALSLAVVGALAAPFVFGTYKARFTYSVRVPLTEQEKASRVASLREHCLRETRDIAQIVCDIAREEYERGWKYEYHSDLPKYLALNVGVAAATFASVFLLAYLIPMLVRGGAFLVRRYWQWLNA